MFNPQRGDVEIEVDGTTRVMRLTLGALAELEARLSADGLAALASRFDDDSLHAADLIAVLAAGLRGAGGEETEDDVAAMTFGCGAVGAVEAAVKLLSSSFRGGA